MLLTRTFGMAHFATILGAIVVVETLGQIVSPTVAGAIFAAQLAAGELSCARIANT